MSDFSKIASSLPRPISPGAQSPLAGGLGDLAPQAPVSGGGASKGGGFLDQLMAGLQSANEKIVGAESLQRRFAAGDAVELEDVVLAMEEASLALEMLVQMRNRGIDTLNELLRVQL